MGLVRRAFGVKGELLVQPTVNEPGAVFAPGRRLFATIPGDGVRDVTIAASRPFKDGWLVTLDAVADRTAAEAWRGVPFALPEDELPPRDEDELLLDELPGMRVVDATLGELGAVAGWYELPQGLVLEVRGERWRADVPFNEAFVTRVDRAARVLTVQLPEGLAEAAH